MSRSLIEQIKQKEGVQIDTAGYSDFDALIYTYSRTKNNHIHEKDMWEKFKEWCLSYNIIVGEDQYPYFFETTVEWTQ